MSNQKYQKTVDFSKTTSVKVELTKSALIIALQAAGYLPTNDVYYEIMGNDGSGDEEDEFEVTYLRIEGNITTKYEAEPNSVDSEGFRRFLDE